MEPLDRTKLNEVLKGISEEIKKRKPIEETVISYPTAILAKQKGIKGWYNKRYNYFKDNKLEPSPYPPPIGIKPDGKQIFAYSQSIVQTWLRDNHYIDVESYMVLSQKNGVDIKQTTDREYQYVIKVKGITYFNTEKGFYQCYEDALERGLQVTLNLLEDEKDI